MKKALFIGLLLFVGAFCFPTLAATENPPYQPESFWVPDKHKRVHSVKLKWKEPTTENAKFYKLVVRNGDKKAEKIGRWNNLSQLGRTISGLKANKLYKARIAACKTQNLCSAYTDWLYFRTKPPQVDRVWTKSASYICARVKLDRVVRDRAANTGYYIKLTDKNDNYIKTVSTAYLGQYRKKGYPICSLEEETKYYLRARAKNSNGDTGKWSPRKRFYTEARDY